MAFSYPEFHGRENEDVQNFLEQMEVACISNRIQDPAQMLRLLQICLKSDARTWSKNFEETLQNSEPPVRLSWENLKRGLETEFMHTEDPDKVWDEVQDLKQRDNEPIDQYIRKFSLAWERLCKALEPAVPPPDMMKKDRFLTGLRESLRWRVELKKPRTYGDAVEVAKTKEWKQKRLIQLGIESSPRGLETNQVAPVHAHVPEEVRQVVVAPVASQVIPAVANTIVPDDGLRQDMRQMVDLMKDLSLNVLNNAGRNRGPGRQSNQPNNDGGQNSGGKRWKNVPTCYNCGELGHISPHCDKPRRMGGDMYPLPAELPNCSNDYGIEIKGDPGPSKLSAEEKGKTKVLSVVGLERIVKVEDPVVMPVGKRRTEEREGINGVGPSKKTGKAYEGKDVKAKWKRRARCKF